MQLSFQFQQHCYYRCSLCPPPSPHAPTQQFGSDSREEVERRRACCSRLDGRHARPGCLKGNCSSCESANGCEARDRDLRARASSLARSLLSPSTIPNLPVRNPSTNTNRKKKKDPTRTGQRAAGESSARDRDRGARASSLLRSLPSPNPRHNLPGRYPNTKSNCGRESRKKRGGALSPRAGGERARPRPRRPPGSDARGTA